MLRLMGLVIVRLCVCLLHLYPDHFRRTFSDEIEDVFQKIVVNADARGGTALLNTSLRELKCLVISIGKERWHERKQQKEKIMSTEDNLPDAHTSGRGGSSSLEAVGMPGIKWVPMWVVLTTVAIPVALILTAPLAALLLLLLTFGVNSGILPSFNDDLLYPLGFFIGFSLILASTQFLMLRNYLPNARAWFTATIGGLITGGLIGILLFSAVFNGNPDPGWMMLTILVSIGIVLGLAQWLVLRRILPNAFWIVPIDVAAACSILLLLAGQSVTGLVNLVTVPLLPGFVTGVGLWILIGISQPEKARDAQVIQKITWPKRPRLAWIGVGLAALVPMFFLCIWIYTTSQLALAKNEGIYATVEEAVIARNKDWGEAEVIRLENVHAGPNSRDGIQPHVWFGGAKVYLDRVPQGGNHSEYSTGSYYIHVKEGWVHVPEGAFPTFIGWVMDVYGLEGVNEWAVEN